MAIRFGLSNGLTVVFEEQHASKVVAMQVWVKAGSADERPDQAGLAHLHEHMLFKGTASRGPGEVAAAIESKGGEINAWTSFDQTVYHAVIASRFAREALEVLADVVRRSRFDPDELAREIAVVCEEIKRSEDTPARRASRDLFSALYQVHPYRFPVLGTPETVRSFTREKVLEFYERHYAPKNAVLSVVGDLTEAEVRRHAEALFDGDWGRPYPGSVARAVEPPLSGRRFVLREDDVKESYLNLAFQIPDVLHEDTPALDLLAIVAGQSYSGRLLLEVKRRRGLVHEIHASAYTPKDPGMFVASMALGKEQPLGPALEATCEVLEGLRSSPVGAEELARAKALIESDAVYGRETVQGLARKLGFYETGNGGIEAEARYYQQIAQVSAERLREVARRYLSFDRCVVTALVPNGTAFTREETESILDRARPAPGPAAQAQATNAPVPVRVTQTLRAKSSREGLIEHTLGNGARLLIREEGAVPLFAIRAAFFGGVRLELPAENGISALHARLLTKGTRTLDVEEIARRIDAAAGSLGGNAGRSSVGLRGEFLSRHFEEGFALFADCLMHPAFPEDQLERERALLLQDIAAREHKPSALAIELFAKTLYQTHPYRLSVLGEHESVAALGPAALQAFHARLCHPSRMVLAVVGDVDADRVIALAEEHFGHAPPPPGPISSPAPEPLPDSPREASLTLARAQSHLVVGFLGLSIDDPDRPALEVLTSVLSGQGGRLFLELRDKRSMAYSIGASAFEGIEPGYFVVRMGTSPEKVEAALEGIRAELTRIREEPVPEPELDRARQHVIGSHEIGLQRNGARAGLFALDALYGLEQSSFFGHAERIAKVTADDVQRVARRLIDFQRCVVTRVGP